MNTVKQNVRNRTPKATVADETAPLEVSSRGTLEELALAALGAQGEGDDNEVLTLLDSLADDLGIFAECLDTNRMQGAVERFAARARLIAALHASKNGGAA